MQSFVYGKHFAFLVLATFCIWIYIVDTTTLGLLEETRKIKGKMTRKHVILIAFLFIITVHTLASPAIDMRKITAPIRKKCLAETGIDVQIVDDAEIGFFPDDRKLACYFKCTLEKFNMITKDGKINFKLISMAIPDMWKEVAVDMIDSCRDIRKEIMHSGRQSVKSICIIEGFDKNEIDYLYLLAGTDSCDLSFNFNKCLYAANPVAYMVP